MNVFTHHIYEYEKGIRNLVLHTIEKKYLKDIKRKLENRQIEYKIYEIKNGRLNVFFGARDCVEVIRKIGKECLGEYTAEEDFMLGIMLGYDRRRQCERFLRFDKIRNNNN